MVSALPNSIELYLTEAGFTPTEMLALTHLLEGTGLTLRELAAKTGKSTGVLDQATKKLLRKNILSRDIVNGAPKYALSSLDAVAQWIKLDLRQKRDMLQRKEQNFDAFLSSLKKEQSRPTMEYFEGLHGLKNAYNRLLLCGEEMLHSLRVSCTEEEDPLREFSIEHLRKKKQLGINHQKYKIGI